MSPLIIAYAIPLVAGFVLLIVPGWQLALGLFLVCSAILAWLGWPMLTGGLPADLTLPILLIFSAAILVIAGCLKMVLLAGRAQRLEALLRRSWRPPSVGRKD